MRRLLLGLCFLIGCAGPDPAQVCHDLLLAGGELDAKGASCGLPASQPADPEGFCDSLAGCSADELSEWQRYGKCLQELPKCDPADKMTWEARRRACAAFFPASCPAR